jgi:PAS domain S-box-containing protein
MSSPLPGFGLDEPNARLLLQSVVGYAIYNLDPRGVVVSWNPGAEKIKGYRAAEIVGKHYSVFYTPEDRASGLPQRELDLAREQPHETEGWRVRKNGQRFWAFLTVTPLFDEAGVLRGYAKVTRDMTESHRAEEERIRLSRAEEALRLRDEFLARASDGLDQILVTIRQQLSSLEKALAPESGRPAASVGANLARIERTLDRIASLAQSVLQLAADTGEQLVRRSRQRRTEA